MDSAGAAGWDSALWRCSADSGRTAWSCCSWRHVAIVARIVPPIGDLTVHRRREGDRASYDVNGSVSHGTAVVETSRSLHHRR